MQIKNRLRRNCNCVTHGDLMRNRVFRAAVGAYILERGKRKRQDVITRVSAEQPLLLAQIKIDAFVELINIAATAKVLNEVVCFARVIRQREVAQKSLSRWVNPYGNVVSRELCPANSSARSARADRAQGVIDRKPRLREITGALQRCRHTGRNS